MRGMSRFMLARNIVILLSVGCLVIGFVGLFILRNTVMQVNFAGGSASGSLQVGKSYRMVGISSTRVTARVQGTVYLTFSDYGSQEILRQEISLLFDPGDDIGIFHSTTIPITNIQVDRSGEYLLSFEPSHTGTSGKIAIQDYLVCSLLGIDEVILIVVGFAGIISAVVVPAILLYYKEKRKEKSES